MVSLCMASKSSSIVYGVLADFKSYRSTCDAFCLKLQELYDNLEKQRPNLFRLASDTDENDPTGICRFLFLVLFKRW